MVGLVLCGMSPAFVLALVPNHLPASKLSLPTALSAKSILSSNRQPQFETHYSFLQSTTSDDAPTTKDSVSTATFEPLFQGVKRDFRNRLPEYKSDIADGLNAQSLATIFFLFFACLAPAVGFGSVLGGLTGGQMGVIEMVASTSLSGVLYAALSAQPVQLIGPQGPVVAFVAALFALSTSLGLPFLTLYAATGSVASVCLALMALTSASNLVKKLSRWTDEIFSVLVSVLFLAQAVGDVSATFAGKAAITALMTFLTCASTFGTALLLKGLPKTRYFTQSIRNNLSNFAPAIGVVVGSLIARSARLKWGSLALLPALQLPLQFVASTGREWSLLSSLLANISSSKLWLAAIPAGIAASVLLYLDQNITARLVNHPRFQQTKGKRTSIIDGMHGDMLVLAGLTGLSSVLGLPWMCGAPTRSAAHVRALGIVDEEGTIQKTIENRVSGFSIHALIGLCAVAASPRSLLATVPKAALSGVFLYLGFTSLQGLELWDRFRGLFQDTVVLDKFRGLKRSTIMAFTAAQMACVWVMMKVTQSKYGVVSPLLIALLPLARWGLIRTGVVTKEDMKVLDD